MNRSDHLLVILMEECAEVQYAASKVLRFGADDCPPGSSTTNAEYLARELVDLAAVARMLEADEIIMLYDQHLLSIEKQDKVEKFLERSRELGRLHEEPAPGIELVPGGTP